MGLKASGDAGAKAQLRQHCARAFRQYDSLLEARKGVGATREQTAVLIDMNVVMMSVPTSVQTLAAFVKIVWSFVEWAVGTGWLTVLVFDEPHVMTNAKRLEQARRDAMRTANTVVCSEDIDPFPFTDDYSEQDLETSTSVLSIRDKRPSRSRMYDEVAKRIFAMVCEKAAKWNQSGKPEHRTVVILDGVDIRGCNRPYFASRNVEMIGNDDAIVNAFHRQTPIGEGDIKLQWLENRIRELAVVGGVLHGTNLVMTSTIDTDSLMIASLAVSKRRLNPFGASVHTVLCMRNPSSKASRGGSGSDDDKPKSASYLVVDVAMLEACILEHIYGKATTVSAEQALNTMLALAASAALSGCDFCSLEGSRFDHFFNSIHSFAKTEPLALESFSNILSTDENTVKRTSFGLTRLCYNASYYMEQKGKRYERQAKSVSEVDDDTLRRALWTSAYWIGNEFKADEKFGFETPASRASPMQE